MVLVLKFMRFMRLLAESPWEFLFFVVEWQEKLLCNFAVSAQGVRSGPVSVVHH